MSWWSRLGVCALCVAFASCGSGGGGTKPPAGGDAGAGAGGEGGSLENRAPSADAGPAQKVGVGDEVTLDGSDSTDPDGDELSFAWKVVSQPIDADVSLSDAEAVRPQFTVPKAGSYVFELTVSDDTLASEPATVSISTSDNRPPIADAGEDQAAKVGDEVALDGTASADPDGDKLTYSWRFDSLPDASAAELSDATAISPSFAVDVEGDYVLELVVNDGALDSEPARVMVSTGNLAPVAEIVVPAPIFVGEQATLDGTASRDVNGDDLTYSWSLTAKPPESEAELENAEGAQAGLTPDVRGDYVVQLIVSDGTVDSEAVTALVVPDNRPPAADAGADASTQVGRTLTLDGSASSDPDHDTLSYSWSIATRPTGSSAELSGADSAAPGFSPDAVGDYVVELVVNDGEASSDVDSVALTVAAAGSSPIIDSFTPASGPAGAIVTVTGSGFVNGSGTVHVFVSTPSGRVEATVVSVSDSEITFILPPGAITGTITIQVGEQETQSSTPLSVDPSTKFELVVEPGAVRLNPGVSVGAIVRLATATGFADLAALTVEGLPAGVTASFKPERIRAGDWSLLTLQAASDQAAAELDLTIRASAEIDNASHSELGQLGVEVLPVTTAFVGRTVLDDPRQSPLAGVTVSLIGKDGNAGSTNCQATTVSDAAGNFAFTNLPVGCTSTQLVRYDGTTTTSPAGDYAGVDLANDIAPGIATQAAALVHLPRIDNAPTVGVKQNSATDQVITFPGIPNMVVTVYAGTTLTMPDGSTPDPFPVTAITVPVDRLPEEVPETQAGFHFFVIAFQPAGGAASQPIAVSYPNELAFTPGTAMPLLTLDPERGVMVEYGTGKVSSDGLSIVPDPDPAHPGHQYGIVHLDWHAPFSFAPPPNNVAGGGAGTGCPAGSGANVDFATGIEQHSAADLGIDGPRGSVAIVRMYRSGNANVGPFGVGTTHNYHYQLSTTALTAATFNFIPPNGNVIPFSRQLDGSYVNLTDPSVAGAVFTAVPGGSELRMLDGTVLGFQPFTRMGGSMLTSITDPNGNKVTLTRGSSPFAVTAVTDPVGRQLLLTHDASARVTSITDPLDRKVSYTYDTDGRLSTVTNVLGKVTKYAYTAKGELSSITDPRNIKVLELTYDENGRASSETIFGIGKSTFEYKVINSAMPASPVVETTVTDPLGATSLYRFNPRGFVLSATDTLGRTNVLDREAASNRIVETSGSGSCGACNGGAGHQQFEYSANGQLLKRIDEAGAATQIAYEPDFGRPSSVKDALGQVTALAYDSKGNLTKVTDALQRASSFEHNQYGQVTAFIDVDGKRSTLAYDAVGNLVAATDPAGNVTRMRYDAISRLVETTDGVGRRSRIRYDAANQVVETIDATGAATKLTYDDIGNVTSITDPRGAVTRYEYDSAGRLTKRIDPVQKAELYGYDSVGRLAQHTDRRGLVTKLAYDALHRVTRATYADSTVDYAYDAEGNVADITDSLSGQYRFTYDARNLLTSSQGPNGALSYTYDLLGRLTTQAVLGQPDTTFAYNAAGQYTRIATEGAGVSFAYDASGRLQKETRDNGVATHYSYDSSGAVSAVRHELDGTNIDLQAYGHDSTGATTYAEGATLGALTTAEVTASYDIANRIQSWGSKTFTHDDDGNRTAVVDGGSSESYAWDARGRLESITQPDGTVLHLRYDFAGNLARISSPDGDETQLTDASGNVVLRRTRDGTIQRLLSGLSMDHHVALVDSKRGVRYPLQARPNSTIATVDGDGLIDGQFAYEPYGATTTVSAPEADYPFLFTGRSRVTEGLYYYRARYYDPLTSRFVSEDPIGFAGGDLNLYGYVGGGPVDRVDPSGNVVPLLAWGLIALAEGMVGVGINGVISMATGSCYSAGDAARDLALGAVTGGLGLGVAKAVSLAARGAAKSQSLGVKVLGRLDDTAVAKDWHGHEVLDIPNWTLAKNAEWVRSGVKARQNFYLASPRAGNMVQTAGRYRGQPTVFAQELQQLEAAGYRQIGDYMVHPANVSGFTK